MSCCGHRGEGYSRPLAVVTLAEAEFHSAITRAWRPSPKSFWRRPDFRSDRASFGVAGPVLAGRAKITNLSWIVDRAALARELNLTSVDLLNDLEAIACAIPVLRPEMWSPSIPESPWSRRTSQSSRRERGWARRS